MEVFRHKEDAVKKDVGVINPCSAVVWDIFKIAISCPDTGVTQGIMDLVPAYFFFSLLDFLLKYFLCYRQHNNLSQSYTFLYKIEFIFNENLAMIDLKMGWLSNNFDPITEYYVYFILNSIALVSLRVG